MQCTTAAALLRQPRALVTSLPAPSGGASQPPSRATPIFGGDLGHTSHNHLTHDI